MFLDDFFMVLQLLTNPIILIGYLLVLLVFLVIKIINKVPEIMENPPSQMNNFQQKTSVEKEEEEKIDMDEFI